MAVLVLVSALSFSVDKHFCGEILVDYSLTGKADSCGMETMLAENGLSDMLSADHCCSEETDLFEGQDQMKELEKKEQAARNFLAIFTYSLKLQFSEEAKPQTPFQGYPPPLITEDIQLLNETFLI